MVDSEPQDIYDTTEIMGDHSELYATVQDAGNMKIMQIIKITKDKNILFYYFIFIVLFYFH